MKTSNVAIGFGGAIVGIIISVITFGSHGINWGTEIGRTISKDSASTLYDNYWSYEGKKTKDDVSKIPSCMSGLSEACVDEIDTYYKKKYRLTNVVLTQKLLKKVNKANRKLKKPEYLKLYIGDLKPKTSAFGFIAVGYGPADKIHAGPVPPDGSTKNRYTTKMYYIEDESSSPTCPYHCDEEWPFEPPH
ncbi:MAG: hypothetical protein N4A46_00610 [Schleiferiaceae bacterium]|jgi:hypothetical protein|nr:hypothetical protein [Schleiferiaceae bacterium]